MNDVGRPYVGETARVSPTYGLPTSFTSPYPTFNQGLRGLRDLLRDDGDVAIAHRQQGGHAVCDLTGEQGVS